MAARIKLIAILKECSTTKQFQYTQHIPLPKQVHHTFATASDGDNVFHGYRFSVYADGAWMMDAKLVVNVGENCCPEECLLDRPVLAAYNSTPVGPERMLGNILETGNLQNAKRTCCNYGNNTSIASRDNLVSVRIQFATPPPVLQQHQAASYPQALEGQTLLQVAHQQAMLQQQTIQQQHTMQ
eukprot:15326209-Ditylum_brightwellii.AAC.1